MASITEIPVYAERNNKFGPFEVLFNLLPYF